MTSITDLQPGEQAIRGDFADSDWARVHLEVQPILELPAESSNAEIGVCIVNQTGATLPGDNNPPLTLHYQLFDADGKKITHKKQLTQLSTDLPPRHDA